MNRNIKIFESPEKLAERFAEDFYQSILLAKAEEKIVHVALSGGTTPKIWFEVLLKKYKNLIPWNLVHFYWGDERMVPSADKESNYGEAKRILLDHISIPNDNIHPVIGENPVDIEKNRYHHLLNENLPKKNNLPCFDLMILGMGDDGHTASIFPNQMQLLKSENFVEQATHPVSRQKRLSLTGTIINNSRKIIFLITGKNKAHILSEIIHKKGEYENFPVASIKPITGEINFYIDKEAASLLNKN